MSRTDHLAKAREYIAIAESGDSKREAYIKARDELLSVRADMTIREIADEIGKGKSWVGDLLGWDPSKGGSPFERDAKDTHEIRQHRDAGRVLGDADEQTVTEIVSALPTQAVERIMHSATNELGQRDRQMPRAKPAKDHKSVERRLHDAAWQLWLIQDELQDRVPEGDERVRMLGVVQSARTFLDALEARLVHGELDDELATLLDEVKFS